MELLELEILSMIVMDGIYLVFRRESDSRITSVRQSITYISHHAYYWPSYLYDFKTALKSFQNYSRHSTFQLFSLLG